MVPAHQPAFEKFRKRPGTIYRILQTVPDRLQKSSKVGGGAGKTTFFKGFLPVMCPVFCFFLNSLYMKRIFKKKIGPRLLLLATGTTDRKVRRSTGVTTANSTNKYQKYKSVELGDQLLRMLFVDREMLSYLMRFSKNKSHTFCKNKYLEEFVKNLDQIEFELCSDNF